MPPTPDAKVSVVFTCERVFDEDEFTSLTGPPDGGGVVMVARFTANVRHEGGEYDDQGNPRSFWLRFVSPAFDKPYLVTQWMSRREMREFLEAEWGGYTVNTDGCDIFSPGFNPREPLVLPETCDACEGDGWLDGQGYGHTDPPGPGVVIQRCDQCEKFAGDVDAAIEYARVRGGHVHAILWSVATANDLAEGPMMAPQSDAWVTTATPAVAYTEIGGVFWHLEADAVAAGWYLNPEKE